VLLFEELLGTSGLGPEDDFFALGGTSLLLLALVDRVKEEFGHELPVAETYNAPTARALARLLAAEPPKAKEERSPLLVTLSPGPGEGGGPPVFLLPSLGGDVTASVELAARIGGEREVVALQPPEFVPGHRTAETFEGLAELYLEAIRTAQPRGPYILGGHSFGGNLAYEVARQLIEQDEAVGCLFILDSLTLQLIQEKFPEETARRPSYEEMVQTGRLPAGAELALQRRTVENAYAHVDLGSRWRPKPFSGELLLLTCEETRAIGGEGLGWERLAGNRLRTERVPGTHQTLLRSPHVEEVAAVLRRWLSAPGLTSAPSDSSSS
jgi:thioesterase domain-containing protein/acyl carrier protein